MGLFKSDKPAGDPAPQPVPDASRGPLPKNAPTPTRREAEAARRERLNPTLSPKEAKARNRAAQRAQRTQRLEDFDNTPQRRLLRDVVDARFNLAEIAMPLLLTFMFVTLIPAVLPYLDWFMYAAWGFMGAMVLDTWIVWRKFKALAAERLPGAPIKGLLFYAFNRQLSFRRWRQPAPRLQRGEQP